MRSFFVISWQFFVALFGATLCIYLIPLCLATLLWFSLRVESINILFVQFFCEITAFGLAGFLTGLLMSICIPSREIKTTLIGILIVALFYIFLKVSVLAIETGWKWKLYFLSEIIIGTLFLVGGAMISAWLIAKKRSSKSQFQTNSK
jgi:hypothetical protein